MTYYLNRRDLEETIRKILPYASFEEDNAGQIVIYTNLVTNKDNSLRELTDADLEECPNCGNPQSNCLEDEDCPSFSSQ